MDSTTIPTAPPEAERAFEKARLTNREREGARSVLARMTAEEAASYMGVAPASVASYRRRAYEKLGIASGTELLFIYGPKATEPKEKIRSILQTQDLSETQMEVLALIATGKTTDQISDELNIAKGTVNSARASGYRLLRIHSKDELIAYLDGYDGTNGPGSAATESFPERTASESDATVTPKKIWGRRSFVSAAAIIAAGTIVSAASFMLAGRIVSTKTIETEYGDIPNVKGSNYQDAVRALWTAGFYPQIQRVENTGETGKVLWIQVKDLNESDEDLGVNFDGSSWKAVAVIGVNGVSRVDGNLGASLCEWLERLESNGIKNIDIQWTNGEEEIEEISSDLTRVVDVSPAPGNWIYDDVTVTVTVSNYVDVPDVVGMSPVEATKAMAECGLSANPHIESWPPEGIDARYTPTCTATEPMAGEKVLVGTKTKITYNGPIDRMPDD